MGTATGPVNVGDADELLLVVESEALVLSVLEVVKVCEMLNEEDADEVFEDGDREVEV